MLQAKASAESELGIDERLSNLDYFFIDMQFSNAGGPATIKRLKALFSEQNITEPYFVLLADREADVFQGKRVGVNEVIIKPITKLKIKLCLPKKLQMKILRQKF